MTSTEAESPNAILIEDFQDISDWKVSGAAEVRLMDDPDKGRCLQWTSASRSQTTMVKDITPLKDQIAGCDAIVFEYWVDGYMSCPAMTLYQIPGYESSRNWYFKFSNRRRQEWRTAWFELKLDDDSLPNDKDPATRIQLAFSGWQTGPEPRYEWRIRNIRAVSFPVALDYDESRKNFEERDGRYSCRYDLLAKNRGKAEHECSIGIDRRALKHFTADVAEQPFVLKPGEQKTITAWVSIPIDAARSLEPLYLEEAPVYLRVNGLSDPQTTVLRGWQTLPLFGAVPPRYAAGDRPRARCDAARLAQLRDWCFREQDFVRGLAWLRGESDVALTRELILPQTHGGYGMGFLCPTCGADLQARTLTEQFCPGCKKSITENRLLNDKAVTVFHNRNADDAYYCALAYALTREEKYATRAKEILIGYAKLAPTMKPVNPLATGYINILAWAMLGESYVCSGFPWAYDFLAAAKALSDAESAQIEADLLLPMLKRMSLHNGGYSNQTAEYRSNQISIALACGHWIMAARALNWNYGFRELLEFAFDQDGWTVEGSQGYQLGAAVCLEEISEAAHFAGADVYADEKCRQILTLAGCSAIPFVRYYDPFARAKFPARSLSRYHNGQLWFFMSPQHLPSVSVGAAGLRSTVRESTGYTFLRLGVPDDYTGIDVNWGQTWERGEHDLFSYRVYVHGQRVDSEVGRIAYTNPFCYFMDKSIASSGIVVDEGNGAINRQLACLTDGGDRFTASMVTTHPDRPLYPGVAITRYLVCLPQGALVVDLVTSDKPHNLDWPFYPPASPAVSVTDLKPIKWDAAQGSGYDVPYDLKTASTNDPIWVQWPVAKRQVRMTIAGGDPRELVVGMAKGRWNGQPIPFTLVRRQRLTRAVSAAFFETFEKDPAISKLAFTDTKDRITVSLDFTGGVSTTLDFRPPRFNQGAIVPAAEASYVSLGTR